MKFLFWPIVVVVVALLLVVDVSLGEEDEKKDDSESNAPATLATPSALFKCGEVRKNCSLKQLKSSSLYLKRTF